MVEPVPTPQIGSDGHKTGVSIIAVAMTTADKFYSADEKGAAFFHSIMSRILYTTVKSIRIHGRHTTPKRIVSAILSIKPLERSLTIPLKVDKLNLVAIASPFKISIFSMKPMPHIVFRATWDELGHAEKVDAKVRSAALSWWRPKSSKQENNPILAVSHGERLVLLKIFKALESSRLSSEVIARCKLEFPITAIEWLNSEVKFSVYLVHCMRIKR